MFIIGLMDSLVIKMNFIFSDNEIEFFSVLFGCSCI